MKLYGTSDLVTNYRGHQFKRLHKEVKIAINTLKIVNNHPHNFHPHHLLQHGDRIFPFFDFENVKFVKNRIKKTAKTRMGNIEAKVKEFVSSKRKSLDE